MTCKSVESVEEDSSSSTTGGTFGYQWWVEDFAKLGHEKIHSDKFYYQGHTWSLLLFPQGNETSHLSFYLDCNTVWEGPPTKLSFHLIVRNYVDPAKTVVKKTDHRFTPQEQDWGYTRCVPLEELRKLGFAFNDQLVVALEVQESQPVPVLRSDEIPLITIPRNENNENFSQFFNNTNMSDVHVIAQTGEVFACHRIILARLSRPFQAMFENGMQECQKKEVHIQNADGDVLRAFLQYMYGCEFHTALDKLVNLCALADQYDVRDLYTTCYKEINKHAVTPHWCCHFYTEAKRFAIDQVKQMCLLYALGCLHVVKDSDGFCNWDAEDVEKLVSCKSLRPMSERTVLDAIFNWVECSPDRQVHLDSLLQHVRFSALSMKDLMEVRRSPVAKQSDVLKDILLDTYELLMERREAERQKEREKLM